MLPMYRLSVLGSAVTVLALTGCAHPVQQTAAHKIADALPTVIGPAAHYDVQVDGDPFALVRGRARGVHIQGQSVQLSPILTVDTLTADAEDVSFDRSTRKLTYVGQTRFTATLSQPQLTTYLAASKHLLPDLTVTLRSDDVVAEVPVTFLGLHTTAALAGTVRPSAADPTRLDFVANGAQIGVVPLPAGLINLALDRLNPVITLEGLRVPLLVTQAEIKDSRLVLGGTADLNGLAAH